MENGARSGEQTVKESDMEILLSGKQYKANLHCHTTVSDGKHTPEEIKQLYKSHGYSVVAYTDHNVLIDRGDLCDDGFIALNGYETEVNEAVPDFKFTRTCHLCFIAEKPDNLTAVGNIKRYAWGNARAYVDKMKVSDPDFERVYTPECINDVISRGRERGFFVTYNHPTWSLEAYPEYSRYRGMNAMEIYNTGCYKEGFDDYNPHAYDDIMRIMMQNGERIFCVAADDNHNHGGADVGMPGCDSFGGWVGIFADEFTYMGITDALRGGRFYASTGPEIFELVTDGGEVRIRTSPARRISYITPYRRCASVHAGETPVTEAVFPISENDGYFRIDVEDERGQHADTSAVLVGNIK